MRLVEKIILPAAIVLSTTTVLGPGFTPGPSVQTLSNGVGQYQVLHTFVESPKAPQGSLIEGSDGDLYGTTTDGGDALAGSLIRIDVGGRLRVLHSFTGNDGAGPTAALVQATDGDFYGTTSAGLGIAAQGTVFKMDAAGTVQTLHFFVGTDGATPQAELIQGSDSNFYSTTAYGGAYGKGTVFKMDTQGVVTTLHSFAGADGEFPSAKLVQAQDGSFYGTTDYGGTSGLGTVFKMDPTSGVVTTLYSFVQATGNTPAGGLVQASDGSLYGTTVFGGEAARGTAYKITTSGVVTPLHEFSGTGGEIPFGGLMQARDGSFYGTTAGGGTGTVGHSSTSTVPRSPESTPPASADPGNARQRAFKTQAGAGTLFKMSASGAVTTLHSFDGSDGTLPLAALLQARNGRFYGTAFLGGRWNRGTVFRMNAMGNVATLTMFPATDAATPSAGLVQATDGRIYGTSQAGGARFQGTVYRMGSAGHVTLLHSFAEDSGLTYPSAELLQGRDGYLYGTTLFGGGPDLAGTMFKMDSSGAVTTLHAFTTTDGAYPYAGLLQAFHGDFYGTTASGGDSNNGVVFEMSPDGVMTTLHSFTGLDGANPQATLVSGGHDMLYGTTSDGGAFNQGTVFRVDARSGAVATVYSFTSPSRLGGRNPIGGLVLRRDGFLYGTTMYGGSHDMGTIFKIDPVSGALTMLHSFTGADGSTPQASLIRGSDGNLYGTTYEGGTNDDGTVFLVKRSGEVASLFSFAGGDGAHPDSRLMQGHDGYLYGTASTGGSSDIGVIFRLPDLGRS